MHKQVPYRSFYPFIFMLYVVVYLYEQNVTEVEWTVIIRPILILLIITALLFLLFKWITRSSQKSALLSFGIMALFLFYGRIYEFFNEHPVFGLNLGHHIILGTIWALLTIAFLIIVMRKKMKVKNNLILFFNLGLACLLIFTSVSAITKKINYTPVKTSNGTTAEVQAQNQWIAESMQPLTEPSEQQLPDIYYIVPDMFARGDVIREETGHDDSLFLESLTAMGFYVADCSRSNYASTQLSIASSLNMNYLDDIQNGLTDRGMLVEPTNHSLLTASLKSLGYTTVYFDNGFGLSEIPDADVTISLPKKFLLFRPYNPFENIIVSNSFLRVFYDVKLGFLSRAYDKLFFPYWEHVETQKYILEQLPNLQTIQGPKFVYAHIMLPHPPYLIKADGTIETNSEYYREALGQPVTEELYLQGYEMQVQYLETQLPEIVNQIIEESAVPPIIIIQGDHGIRYSNRLDNLNAYYVPESIKEDLYSTITPVNSFRLILNGLYGTEYPLLEDRSYYSVYPDWFEMTLDPEHNQACLQSSK